MNTQNANIQGPMQAAIHSANILAEQKKAEKETSPMPAVVIRQDLLGNKILFLADTQTKENTIQFWDGKKGSKPSVAPLAFYKSTKPLETKEEVAKMAEAFGKEFGVKHLDVRQRLIKSSVLHREEDGSISGKEISSFKERLKAAIIKAIDSLPEE